MKELVYKFLDGYVGSGIGITINKRVARYNPYIFNVSHEEFYDVTSDNGTLILYFKPDCIGGASIYPEHSLCNTISNMFSIKAKESKGYILEWFYKKYNIKNYRQLLERIPSV